VKKKVQVQKLQNKSSELSKDIHIGITNGNSQGCLTPVFITLT